MAYRDPETGKFVSDDDRIDRIEQLHAHDGLSVPASDLDGATGQSIGEGSRYEGRELYDFESVLDRDEVGVIQWQVTAIRAFIASTQTADGTVYATVETSLSPSTSMDFNEATGEDIQDQAGEFSIEGHAEVTQSDSGDIVGPFLTCVGFGPFSDGASGVGGAGTTGAAEWEGPVIVDPVVDDRDSLYHNGRLEASNVSDASAHLTVDTWTTVAVMEE